MAALRLLLAKADGERQASRIGDQTGGRVFLFLETDDFVARPSGDAGGRRFLQGGAAPRSLWHGGRVRRPLWQPLGPDRAETLVWLPLERLPK